MPFGCHSKRNMTRIVTRSGNQTWLLIVATAADVRRACTDALFAIQPCLSLLSSASQMWEPLQSSSQQTPPQQVTFQETQSPLQHRVQNQSKLVQQNTNGSVLPPLPESQVSALRQRARLTSLHIVGEDEQEVRRHLGDEEDDAGMLKPYDEEEGVRGARIQIPHELQVCTHYNSHCSTVVPSHSFLFFFNTSSSSTFTPILRSCRCRVSIKAADCNIII